MRTVACDVPQMSHYDTSSDGEYTWNFATSLCRGGIQTPCRTVFSYEARCLVMERPREACLPRSNLTRPAALQPQRSRIYRGVSLPGAVARLRSYGRGVAADPRPHCAARTERVARTSALRADVSPGESLGACEWDSDPPARHQRMALPRASDNMSRGRCREQMVCFRLLGLVDDDLDVARIATAVVEGQHRNTLLGF